MNRKDALTTLRKIENVCKYARTTLEMLTGCKPHLTVLFAQDTPAVNALYSVARQQRWNRHANGTDDIITRSLSIGEITIHVRKPDPVQRVRVKR